METFDNMLKRKCKKFLTRCGDTRNEENKSNVLANRVIIRAGTSNTERREFNCVQECLITDKVYCWVLNGVDG